MEHEHAVTMTLRGGPKSVNPLLLRILEVLREGEYQPELTDVHDHPTDAVEFDRSATIEVRWS